MAELGREAGAKSGKARSKADSLKAGGTRKAGVRDKAPGRGTPLALIRRGGPEGAITQRLKPEYSRVIQQAVAAAERFGPEAVERTLDQLQQIPPEAGISDNLPASVTERWAEIRKDWLRRHRSLTAAEIAALVGSETANPSALLNGWVSAKRVFFVQDGAKRLYPEFQLGPSGQPKEVFRSLITALQGKRDGWHLAIWLTKPNPEFGHWQTPLEMLDRDPEAVVAAAKREAQEAVL